MIATEDFQALTSEYLHFLRHAPAPSPAPSPNADSAELARAMQDYKNCHNRPFPTWSEVLEVLRGLGYARRADFGQDIRHEVRINRTGPATEEIREVLARFGGSSSSASGQRYAFPSAKARDRALDAVRADQGWTSIDPV